MCEKRISAVAQSARGSARRNNVLAFDAPADADYGAIRAELEASGRSIGSNDLLIAAHAVAIGATMVTAHRDEFSRVRGLKVENWLA